NDLARRAGEAGLGHPVQAHCMDMKDIPQAFPRIDLLWSEGAAYHIGFPNALATWATALRPGAFAGVRGASWLEEDAPEAARDFFRSGYPDMRAVQDNVAAAAGAGFKVLATHTLPRQAWVDDYYDVLGPRAKALLDHPAPAIRDFAAETVREIEVFKASEGSYGYVFFALQRA